jgi:hypothetical protein
VILVRIKAEKLQPGMVLAQDLLGANGISLKTGTTLTNRFISLIGNKHLFPQDDLPVTDESYSIILARFTDEIRKESGSLRPEGGNSLLEESIGTYGITKIRDDLYAVNENLTGCPGQLNIPGTLNVNGSIMSCPSLFISGTVFVRGNVTDSGITAKKDVQILGDVINTTPSATAINCFGNFSARNVQNVRINANSIVIEHGIINSDLKADTSIEGPYADRVRDSQLQAGFNIVLGSVREKTTLVIFSEKQVDLVKKLMEVSKKIGDFDRELDPLRQSIKVYQLLKDRLQDLPADKREKLMTSLKLVKTKLEKKKFLDEQFTTLKIQSESIRKSRETMPIVINDSIAKGTKVLIDNHSFVVQLEEKGVVFYKKSFIIMGKKDREWGKLG